MAINLESFLLAFMCFVFALTSSAQEISLLTVDPGDMVYDAYGHSALRVNDKERGIDRVYNYGLYDFDTPGFVMKFMRGKLLYQVGAHRYSDFLYNYNQNKRSVYEQKINLSGDEKEALIKALRINMMKENRSYKYDFFFDNCSTRLRDLFENVVEHTDDYSNVSNLTFRDLIKEFQYGNPWTDFGIDIIIGSNADNQATIEDQMFLPLYLKSILTEAKVMRDGEIVNLLSPQQEILSFPKEAAKRKSRFWLTPELIFLFIAIVLLMIRSPYRISKELPKWIYRIDKSFLFLFALLGCIVAFMWWGTDHIPTKANWNLLWLNPLIFVPVFFSLPKHKWVRIIIYFLVALCFIALVNLWVQFLPQQFHVAFGWLILIEMLALISLLKWSK